MKQISAILLSSVLAFSALSQTNTNTVTATNAPVPTFAGGLAQIWDAVKTTNWFGVSYALYAPSLQSHWGGGVGVFAPVTTNLFGTFNVLAGTRLDWVDGGFWMPSGNVSLEAPISVTSWLTLSPIAYAGIGVPVSGARVGNFNVPGLIRDNNDQATAITGAGLAVTIWKRSTPATAWYQPRSLQLAADVETWTGFAGPQYRFGISGHF
jgi:hypothetical protein